MAASQSQVLIWKRSNVSAVMEAASWPLGEWRAESPGRHTAKELACMQSFYPGDLGDGTSKNPVQVALGEMDHAASLGL